MATKLGEPMASTDAVNLRWAARLKTRMRATQQGFSALGLMSSLHTYTMLHLVPAVGSYMIARAQCPRATPTNQGVGVPLRAAT